MRAEELVLAVERLDAPLDYFTDPFRLAGEGRFSWRHTGPGADRLTEYEREAGRSIAAFLIARHEVEGRRHFDLAHELFHILTWDAMPPQRSEEARERGGSRVEQLANNFAAALLMPTSTLERFGSWANLADDRLVARLNAAADELQVTSSALRWRLVALGELRADVACSLPGADLVNNGRRDPRGRAPAPFSRPFLEVLGLAIDGGHVSVRRLADLLDRTVEDLADLFAEHGLERKLAL